VDNSLEQVVTSWVLWRTVVYYLNCKCTDVYSLTWSKECSYLLVMFSVLISVFLGHVFWRYAMTRGDISNTSWASLANQLVLNTS